MSTWITLKNGNKIDLDQIDSSKSMKEAISDYYSLKTTKELKLPKDEYAMVMSNINTFYYHFNKSNLKVNAIAFKAIRNYIYVFKINDKFNSQIIIDKLAIENFEEDREVN